LEWSLLEGAIRERFPHARTISPEELDRWLEDPRRKPPLLLDLRSVEEYQVSHLPGAIRLSPRPQAWRAWRLADRSSPIVAYDSVGWRSGAFVEEIAMQGFQNAWYLQGGIFRWAHEGRKLQCDGAETHRVHPGDSYYGQLLDPGLRSVPLDQLPPPIF
jgi:rhodanese-related sulfurtransferase